MLQKNFLFILNLIFLKLNLQYYLSQKIFTNLLLGTVNGKTNIYLKKKV